MIFFWTITGGILTSPIIIAIGMRGAVHQSLPYSGGTSKAAQGQRQKTVLGLFDLRMKGLKTAQACFLGVWAILNLVGGIFSILTISDQFFYIHFHAMNACWGLVNLGVAAFIYFHHNSVFDQLQTVLQQMEHQRHAEKMMVLNMGLDLDLYQAG